MQLYVTINGKVMCVTNNATLAPRKGDVIELGGCYFKVKNVVWHMSNHTEVEIQVEHHKGSE